MMQISKIDTFDVKLAKPRDLNPLNSIDITLELLFKHDAVAVDTTGAVKVHEKEIHDAIKTLFKGKFINKNE
jgi:hypothetical protein